MLGGLFFRPTSERASQEIVGLIVVTDPEDMLTKTLKALALIESEGSSVVFPDAQPDRLHSSLPGILERHGRETRPQPPMLESSQHINALNFVGRLRETTLQRFCLSGAPVGFEVGGWLAVDA